LPARSVAIPISWSAPNGNDLAAEDGRFVDHVPELVAVAVLDHVPICSDTTALGSAVPVRVIVVLRSSP
jgi:hypothetical protein